MLSLSLLRKLSPRLRVQSSNIDLPVTSGEVSSKCLKATSSVTCSLCPCVRVSFIGVTKTSPLYK